jgi:hypothetical protein
MDRALHDAPIRSDFGESLGTAAHTALLQVLAELLEQDLAPGQGDVGAFEASMRSRALGHARGN